MLGTWVRRSILIVTLSLSFAISLAQNNTPILSPEEMLNAPIIDENLRNVPIRTEITNPQPQSGIYQNRNVYKLSTCDENNTDAACYLVVTVQSDMTYDNTGRYASIDDDSGLSVVNMSTTAQPEPALTGYYSCWIDLTNFPGYSIARFQTNAFLVYHRGTTRPHRLPATPIFGNNTNTYSHTILGWWTDIQVPTASLGWGVKVKPIQNYLTIVSSAYWQNGVLGIPAGGRLYNATIMVDRRGTYCSVL